MRTLQTHLPLVEAILCAQIGKKSKYPLDLISIQRSMMKTTMVRLTSQDGVMMTALRHKFQKPELKKLLLSTGNHPLVQLKPGDGYWGSGPSNCGLNRLGALLQDLRTEYQEAD